MTSCLNAEPMREAPTFRRLPPITPLAMLLRELARGQTPGRWERVVVAWYFDGFWEVSRLPLATWVAAVQEGLVLTVEVEIKNPLTHARALTCDIRDALTAQRRRQKCV
jgi:hypothetical protein